MLEIKVV